MNKKVAFHTLGCKLNFSETSTLAREFEAGGFSRAQKGEVADIIVINSCSVTGEADKKCRYLVRRLVSRNPEAIVVVTGCYAQLKPEEVASIEGVDLVVGNNSKGEIFERVSSLSGKVSQSAIDSCSTRELTNFFSAFSSGDRTRTFLKVQDGCSYHCSYCTIPLARGESRNIPISDLVSQAEAIAAKGQREIVLTGVNIGDFGRTTGESFLELIEALDQVEGIDRYRISSIEPNLISDPVIEFCARSKKFMPHFHIPLQAGTNKILGAMRRRYTIEKFADRISRVRELIANAFIGIDIIVGFPGETVDDFEQTKSFLRTVRPSFLHIFPYSERDNTDAVRLEGKVSASEKHRRVEELASLSRVFHYEFALGYCGSVVEVLVEGSRKEGLMFGYTRNYVKVSLPYDRGFINQILTVRLSDRISDDGVIEVLEVLS